LKSAARRGTSMPPGALTRPRFAYGEQTIFGESWCDKGCSGESAQDVRPNRSLSTIAHTNRVSPGPDDIQGIDGIAPINVRSLQMQYDELTSRMRC
jgi:hypothetical protein